MITDTQRRNQIFRRISKIPKEKLKKLEEYVAKLEKEDDLKSKNLSFAGAWKDIDNTVFDDFTKNLIEMRESNRGRIDE